MVNNQKETIIEDPQATEIVEKIRSMSNAEVLTDIFRHEKEVRGIDWLALAAHGPEGIAKARRQAKVYLTKLQSEMGLENVALPEFDLIMRRLDEASEDVLQDGVQLMPTWGINEKEALVWKAASGDALKNLVTFRLKIMQALELTSGENVYAQIGLSIGVLAWLKRAYDAYKIARAAGFTTLSSVVQGIRAVTLNATKLFVAAVIVAVIAEVFMFLMQKKAVVYMVLINMTDDDLVMKDLGIVNGKQLVQFVNPQGASETHYNVLTKRLVIDLPDGIEANYWVGLFAASKRDNALIGSLGAFNFMECPSFPNSVYVGWDIPLTSIFGGPNRCLVSASNEGNCKKFADETEDKGSLYSTADSGVATVTARMHSGSGSEGYMSVIFEPKSSAAT